MKNKTKWILIVFVLSFILSVIFSAVSTSMANSFNTIMLVFITLAVIFIAGTSSIFSSSTVIQALNFSETL